MIYVVGYVWEGQEEGEGVLGGLRCGPLGMAKSICLEVQ